MNTELQPIGVHARVSFPKAGIFDVPAKVDTGADSSSLWASRIAEQDGILSFTLFDQMSPYYTGETIRLKDYKIVSVKNSFGRSEYRYKVRLPVVIEGRKIQISVTLADRSRNRYPILIGRRTLKGKFLVHVTGDHAANVERRVMIVSAIYSDNVKRMTESVEGLMENTTIDRTIYDDMLVSMNGSEMSVTVFPTGKDLASYDLVHFKTSVQRDITAALARYARFKGVRVLDDIVQYFPTTSKLYEYVILANAGIAVPPSLFVTPKRLLSSFETFRDTLSLPFILKGIHTSKGQFNDVIRDEADFNRVAKKAFEEDVYLIGQAFIPNAGDYRVLVFGKQIALVIYRSRTDSMTHLNNTSQGADATIVQTSVLPSQIQIDSIRAAALMGRDIAGVDMVQDEKTSQWYCLEVNDGPQLATGTFLEEKYKALAGYLQRELEK